MSENRSPIKQILYTALICMAAAAIAIVGWKLLMPKGDAEAEGPQTGSKTIEVQVVHGDGSTQDFTLETEAENLGTALIENSVVEDNQGPYGLYILTADGETANESNQEWWQITRGGERLNTGADSTPIADGEHYELTFTVGYDQPGGDGEDTTTAGITVEVQVIHGDGSTNDFTLHTEAEDLGTALVEHNVVEDNQGPYGLYILTADGETANESKQEWWQITKGGERLNTGADSTPIADGEHYELTFTVGYN